MKTEQGEARMQEVMRTLERGIEAILTSEGYRAYLAAMSRFHGYSFNNIALILCQRPDATCVAGFHTWRRMDRFVKKGEKGIRIMIPYKAKVEMGDDDPLSIIRGFGVGTVFDVSQTDGQSLPEPPHVTEPRGGHAAADRITDALTHHALRCGVAIVRDHEGNRRGYWHPTRREIGIRADLTGIGEAKTVAHEVAHFLADHRGNVAREDAEDVAESAAYVTLMHRGIDTGAYSFGYVAGWAKDMRVFHRNLGEVERIGHQMIEIVDGD